MRVLGRTSLGARSSPVRREPGLTRAAPRTWRAGRRLRHKDLPKQIKKPCPGPRRMPPVIGQHQPYDEPLVIITRQRRALGIGPTSADLAIRLDRTKGPALMGHIHPATRLVHQMLELPGQALPDLP